MYKVYDQVLRDFSQIMNPRNYKKGEIVHQAGQVCKHLYFVELGILRSYYLKNGKDITAHIAIDKGVISSIDSLMLGVQSRYTIEALEDSQVLEMHYLDMEEFLTNHPHHERTARFFTQEIYMELVERVESLLFNDAQEKYHRLIDRHPNLVQRVGLGHIASFLGITQETLSRVRATYTGP